MQKRPQARRSLTSSKSCDEPEEESPSNRAEKKPAKKAGRLASDDLQRDKPASCQAGVMCMLLYLYFICTYICTVYTVYVYTYTCAYHLY